MEPVSRTEVGLEPQNSEISTEHWKLPVVGGLVSEPNSCRFVVKLCQILSSEYVWEHRGKQERR